MEYKRLVLDQYDELSIGSQPMDKLAASIGAKSIPSRENIDRLEDDDFAVVIIKEGERFRRFPINTKANTMLSKAAFERNGTKMTSGGYNTAEARLKIACGRFGLPHQGLETNVISTSSPYYLHTHIKELKHQAKVAQLDMDKTASMKKFALDAKRNGHPIQKYDITTPADVLKAASQISPDNIPVEWFMKAARNTLDRAKELGVSIPENCAINIVKNAELSDVFKRQIRHRMRLSSPEGSIEYALLNKKASVSDMPSLAVEMEFLDLKHHHRSRWGRQIERPAVAVFGLPKQAEQIDMDTGSISSEKLSDFIKENRKSIASAIGEDATQSLIDDPAVAFKALPAPHRQYISENFGGTA